MTINGIKTNVQALLVGSGLFSANSVQPAPQEGDSVLFDSYPAVSHYYHATTSDFATVSQNRRVIEYYVEIYLVTSETDSRVEFQKMYDLSDAVIQLFDNSRDLSSTSLGLTRACDIARPAGGEIMRVNTNDGVGLMMTIRLYCESDVAFNGS